MLGSVLNYVVDWVRTHPVKWHGNAAFAHTEMSLEEAVPEQFAKALLDARRLLLGRKYAEAFKEILEHRGWLSPSHSGLLQILDHVCEHLSELEERASSASGGWKEVGVLTPVKQGEAHAEVKQLRREVKMLRSELGQMSLAVDNWHARAAAAEKELDRLAGAAPVSGEVPPRAENQVARMSSVITHAQRSQVKLREETDDEVRESFVERLKHARSLISAGKYASAQLALRSCMLCICPGDPSLKVLSLVVENLDVLAEKARLARGLGATPEEAALDAQVLGEHPESEDEKLAQGLGATPGEAALDKRVLGECPDPDEALQEALKKLFGDILVYVGEDSGRLTRVPECVKGSVQVPEFFKGLKGVVRLQEGVAGESKEQMGLVLSFDDCKFFLRISHPC